MLSMDERRTMMRSHGMIGRSYAGKVKQIITGSVGFDDWEWGVTLFADDALQFKNSFMRCVLMKSALGMANSVRSMWEVC